jgi:capsular polysaccharide biosynthesis protein
LAGFGIGLAADYLDRSFRTPQEVEAFLGVPVLASLPFVDLSTSKVQNKVA